MQIPSAPSTASQSASVMHGAPYCSISEGTVGSFSPSIHSSPQTGPSSVSVPSPLSSPPSQAGSEQSKPRAKEDSRAAEREIMKRRLGSAITDRQTRRSAQASAQRRLRRGSARSITLEVAVVRPVAESREPRGAGSGGALEHTSDALPDADAHARQAPFAVRAAQVVDQGRGDARARAAERMTQGDRAAERVDLVGVELERADAGEGLAGEGLVELDRVELADLDPSALHRFAARGDRSDAHHVGVHTRVTPADDPGHGLEPERLGAGERG